MAVAALVGAAAGVAATAPSGLGMDIVAGVPPMHFTPFRMWYFMSSVTAFFACLLYAPCTPSIAICDDDDNDDTRDKT